ncbi:MAG: hypothetical protein MJ231_06025 [bacterium]|nr:hypothetical protein [bacterium]
MTQTLKNAIAKNSWFYILVGISIVLIITSFLVPPLGVIDGSVLASVGELFAFASLGTLIKAIDKGKKASVTHKDTTLTVGDNND